MYDLMVSGGLLFMLPLTALGGAILALIAWKSVDLFGTPGRPPAMLRRGLYAIIQLGGFSFFLGILAQAIGLYQMLSALEAVRGVSPPLVAGGLKVSMIAPIYGLLILLVAALGWFVLTLRFKALVAVEET